MVNLLSNEKIVSDSIQVTDEESILDYLKDKEEICLDTETEGLVPFNDKLLLLTLGDSDNQFVIDIETKKENCKYILSNLQDKLFIMHNAKFDYIFIKYHLGISLNNLYCTYIASQVNYNGFNIKHNLKDLLFRHFNIILDKTERETFVRNNLLNESQIIYAANDIKYLEKLKNRQEEMSLKLNLTETIRLEMELIPYLGDMELTGLLVDKDKWNKYIEINKNNLKEISDKIKDELYKLQRNFKIIDKNTINSKHDINQLELFSDEDHDRNLVNKVYISSSNQMLKILNKLGVYIESTKSELLQKFILDNPQHKTKDLIELLLKYRKYSKFVSTYGDSFLNSINKTTKRLHSNISQCSTDTGRISSKSYSKNEGVNLQNIPADNDLRHCFISRQGYKIITIDYSQQEITLAASQSQDPLLLAACNNNIDLHTELATISYRIITKDPNFVINKEIRTKHKRVVFGLFYGAGAKRISEVLNIDNKTALEVYSALMEKLSEFNKYQENIKKALKEDYIVRDHSYTNRMKFFHQLLNKEMELYEAEKQACNFPIQSSGASMIKKAIIECGKYIKNNNLDCRILFTVHDELLFESKEEIANDVANDLKNIMEKVGLLFLNNVAIKASVTIDEFWTK